MKKVPNVAYTIELKVEALRRVRSREAVRKVAREIGVPNNRSATGLRHRPREAR